MLSPYFAVAGIDKLRFQFFPSGYKDSTSDASMSKGMCSLFLHCPAGTTIAGLLSINLNGNIQKRPIEHTYMEAGSFGRTQFCRYDVIPTGTQDDHLIIALDVSSAQQQVISANNAPDESGVVKLVRGVDTKDAALSDTRVLPTLWTRSNVYGEKLNSSIKQEMDEAVHKPYHKKR